MAAALEEAGSEAVDSAGAVRVEAAVKAAWAGGRRMLQQERAKWAVPLEAAAAVAEAVADAVTAGPVEAATAAVEVATVVAVAWVAEKAVVAVMASAAAMAVERAARAAKANPPPRGRRSRRWPSAGLDH